MINKYLKEKTDARPIWFMRQAGRYLPEYQALRKKNDFMKLCFSPSLASEVSLQPIKRFDLSAVILFSDILVLPYALGQKVEFKEKQGPILEPIKKVTDLPNLNINQASKTLAPIYETLSLIKQKKPKHIDLIGFCGSPFTVLTYMIEGGTSRLHEKIKIESIQNTQNILDLLDVLTELSIEYLLEQIRHGAQVIQIFETWAGLLSGGLFQKMIVEPNRKIVEAIKKACPAVPVICFPKDCNTVLIKFLKDVPCDVISVDEKVTSEIIEFCKEKKISIQGNLDPIRLLIGGKQMADEIEYVMKKFNGCKHVFNLSHGILPTTPISNVEKAVQLVKNYATTRN